MDNQDFLKVLDSALIVEAGKIFAFLKENDVLIGQKIIKEYENRFEKMKGSVKADDVHFYEVYKQNPKDCERWNDFISKNKDEFEKLTK